VLPQQAHSGEFANFIVRLRSIQILAFPKEAHSILSGVKSEFLLKKKFKYGGIHIFFHILIPMPNKCFYDFSVSCNLENCFIYPIIITYITDHW